MKNIICELYVIQKPTKQSNRQVYGKQIIKGKSKQKNKNTLGTEIRNRLEKDKMGFRKIVIFHQVNILKMTFIHLLRQWMHTQSRTHREKKEVGLIYHNQNFLVINFRHN